MQPQQSTGNGNTDKLVTNPSIPGGTFPPSGKRHTEFKHFLQQIHQPVLDDLLMKLTATAGKKSFLVFRNNKYLAIPTKNIALFCIRYELATMVCFDNQEYVINYSLDQIQNMLTAQQFYRLNRQYLINFNAVKEVEHYFARKLLVNSVIPTKEKLVVPKDKVNEFLHWLDNR